MSNINSDTEAIAVKSRPYYNDLRRELNRIFRELQAAPIEYKEGYRSGSIGSILNAYREGDVSFNDAVAHIEKTVRGQMEAAAKIEAVRPEPEITVDQTEDYIDITISQRGRPRVNVTIGAEGDGRMAEVVRLAHNYLRVFMDAGDPTYRVEIKPLTPEETVKLNRAFRDIQM